jgi:hypothetical protein
MANLILSRIEKCGDYSDLRWSMAALARFLQKYSAGRQGRASRGDETVAAI